MKIHWGRVAVGVGLTSSLVGYGYINQKRTISPDPSLTRGAEVTRVIDGDTLDTATGVRVRLWGIDAPEYPEGCLSEAAKKRLEELVLNKKMTMVNKGVDNFNRTLALVYVDKLLINKALLTEGMAVYDAKVNADDLVLQEMEKTTEEAKAAKRGVWSSKCSQPNSKCVIKGNYRQAGGTRVYSLPDCYNYDRIVVNPVGGDKWFCGETEAVKAGFKKSLDCPGYK
ncbi:MAG: thermonuclease family protein [Patescibacteria group bacterium]